MAYEINYDDERFQEVEADRKQALTENEQLYGGMVADSQKYFNEQIEAVKDWSETQQKNQQEQTDFAIQKIEQEKDKTKKDYIKEQSGAYVDWQKESNRYGENAERFASQGFTNSGYSESSQVSMYNTYQNRVATARESYNLAIQNYNNSITEARLQNNAALAEIAYNALQQQLELSLQGFQYQNQLLAQMADQKAQIETRFDNKYQAVLDQMNTENALQEELRQFNATYSLQQQQLREEIRQFDEEIERLKEKDAQEYQLELKKLQQQKELAQAELAEEQRQFNASMAQKSSNSSVISSKKSSGSGSTNSTKSSSTTRTHSSGSRSFGSGSSSTQTYFSSYEQAASYLRAAGATKGDGGLMTKSEWSSRRSRGSTGAEAQYKTYDEYLNNYIAWKVKNPD